MNSSLRVLHVAAGNLYGGVETLLVTLARHHDASATVEPNFACCFEGRLSEELRTTGSVVHHLGEVRVRRPWAVWQARRHLRRLIRQEGYAVVVCHGAWPQAIFGPAALAGGAALVFWLHGATAGTHWLERWARKTTPDLAVCNSWFTALSLPAMYPRVRVEVLHCPVAAPDVSRTEEVRREVRRELGASDDTIVLLQASRMEPLKGHAFLLQALGQLRSEPGATGRATSPFANAPGSDGDGNGRWVLWLAGGAQRPEEQAYAESLRAVAAALGVADRVRFLGQRADVPRLMAAADVYCQANIGPEGFGISFVEAMYAGLPVVTTALGGAREVIDESTGVLVPPASVDALADAIDGLLTDPARRAGFGAAGPARARRLCDPATQSARLSRLLTGVARPKAVCRR